MDDVSERFDSLWIIEAPGKISNLTRVLADLGYKALVVATQGHFIKMPPHFSSSGIDANLHEFLRRIDKPHVLKNLQDGIARLAPDGQIYIATDADTEGHVIATDISDAIQHLPLANIPLRVLLRALDRESIRVAVKDARPIRREDATAGRARAIIDRLIGASMRSMGVGAGRVKAAILGILVENPPGLEHFRLVAPARGGGREWTVSAPIQGIFDADDVARLIDLSLPVLDEIERVDARPLPDDMGHALIRAGDEINLSPKEAAMAMQAAYEAGSLSYPRSDARGISREAVIRLSGIYQASGQTFVRAFVPDRDPKDVHDSPWPIGPVTPSNHPQSLGSIEGVRAILARNLLRSGQRCMEGRHKPGVLEAFLVKEGFSESFAKAIDALPWAREIGPRRHGAAKKAGTINRRADTALLEACIAAGIGKPSTYAAHIDNLLQSGAVDGKLRLTEKGRRLVDGIPQIMLSPDFSRMVERECQIEPESSDIRYEAWQVRAREIIANMPEPVRSMVYSAIASSGNYAQEEGPHPLMPKLKSS